MKKTTGILIAAGAILSFAAVAAVQAQDAMMHDNTNSTGDQMVSNDNQNANVNQDTDSPGEANANVNENANANLNLNENVNTGAEMNANENVNVVPPPPVIPENDNVGQTPAAPPQPTLHNGNTPPMTGMNAPVSSAGKLQKIPTPDHIKLFTNIRQIGNSLFGLLKNIGNGTAPTQNHGESTGTPGAAGANPSATAAPSGQNMEKILSPDLIKFFTGIKKIGSSLFGMRIGGTAQHPVVTSDESACVIAAIQAKDQAATSAVNDYASAFAAAVSARTACQTAALGSTDGQQDALAKCVKAFTAAAVQAKAAQAKAQAAAWSDYRTALRACAPAASSVNSNSNANTGTPAANASGGILIEDGGDSI